MQQAGQDLAAARIMWWSPLRPLWFRSHFPRPLVGVVCPASVNALFVKLFDSTTEEGGIGNIVET